MSHHVTGDRPAFVISPAPVKIYKIRGESFTSKAKLLNEIQRWQICWLDISLQAMQFKIIEGVAEQQSEAFSHIAFTNGGRESAIAEYSAVVRPSHDLADINKTQYGARLAMTYEEAFGCDMIEPCQVIVKLTRSLWHPDPLLMQSCAGPGQFGKFPCIVGCDLAELDPPCSAGICAGAIQLHSYNIQLNFSVHKLLIPVQSP
jgi:hypothetical protein